MPDFTNDREEAIGLLKDAGFTEAQADVLATMYEVLLAECRQAPLRATETASPNDDVVQAWWREVQRNTARGAPGPTPSQGVWQHPSLSDLFPEIMRALPGLLELLMARLRPKPRPWWQQQLRKLAGIDP